MADFVPVSSGCCRAPRVSGRHAVRGTVVKIHLRSGESALPVDGRGPVKPLSGDGSGPRSAGRFGKIVSCNAMARDFPLATRHRDRFH